MYGPSLMAHALDACLEGIPSITRHTSLSLNHVSPELWLYVCGERKPDFTIDLTVPQADGNDQALYTGSGKCGMCACVLDDPTAGICGYCIAYSNPR